MDGVRLIISGDVIGVGYRSWALRLAKSLGVFGWVKNREDGTVELVAEGKPESLAKLIAACKKGPDVAWVHSVDVTWLAASGELVDFTVLY